MAITDKLKAIANAIRTKTGKTEAMTLNDMPSEIEAIESYESGYKDGEKAINDVMLEFLEGRAEKVYFPPQITKIGGYAFYRYTSIKGVVVLPDTVESTGYSAFDGVKNITEFYGENLITNGTYGLQDIGAIKIHLSKVKNTGAYGIASNANLVDVFLPKCEIIERGGLRLNKSLEKVNLPSCKAIQAEAFQNDNLLQQLVLRNEDICNLENANAFTGTPIASGTGYIYVPSALIEDYKVATNWAIYASQFRAIEDYSGIVGG